MKIRSNYVSNSSSSSFILNNKEDIENFKVGYYINKEQSVFSTNEIKETIKFFIKDFTTNYEIENDYSFDEIWNKYFENKVPVYFKYHHIDTWNIMEWNFSGLKELLKDLPDDKWLTDSYDRDWISEYCHLPSSIEEFEGDM